MTFLPHSDMMWYDMMFIYPICLTTQMYYVYVLHNDPAFVLPEIQQCKSVILNMIKIVKNVWYCKLNCLSCKTSISDHPQSGPSLPPSPGDQFSYPTQT